MKTKQRNQKAVLLVLVFLIIYLIYEFILGPVLIKYKKLYSEEKEMQSRIESNITIMKNRNIIEKNYDSLFKTYKLTGDDDEENLKTKQEIESISRTKNLKINKIDDAPIKIHPDYKEFSIRIECAGTLNQIQEFIFYLSKSPFLFNVEKIRIQSESSTSTGDSLRAAINISRIGVP